MALNSQPNSNKDVLHLSGAEVEAMQDKLSSADLKAKNSVKSEIETIAQVGMHDAETLLRSYEKWSPDKQTESKFIYEDRFKVFLEVHNISDEKVGEMLTPVYQEAAAMLRDTLKPLNEKLYEGLKSNWRQLSEALKGGGLFTNAANSLERASTPEQVKDVYLRTIAGAEEKALKMDIEFHALENTSVNELLKRSPLFASMNNPESVIARLLTMTENYKEKQSALSKASLEVYMLISSIPTPRTKVPQKLEEKNKVMYQAILKPGELIVPGYASEPPYSFYDAVTQTWDSLRYFYKHEKKIDLPTMAELRISAGKSAHPNFDN